MLMDWYMKKGCNVNRVLPTTRVGCIDNDCEHILLTQAQAYAHRDWIKQPNDEKVAVLEVASMTEHTLVCCNIKHLNTIKACLS